MVRFLATAGVALALSFSATGAALAKNKGHCPPGLAKKAVPCVPPGQAKKGGRAPGYEYIREYDGYRAGDRYVWSDRYNRFRDYDRYRLPRLRENETYYRDGHFVLRVDNETRRVIDLIRLADLVLSN